MLYSDARFDDKLKKIITDLKPKSVLDIGPGAGKYGKLIRSIDPNILINAVEIDKKYIGEFKLKNIYDKVFNTSIEKFIETQHDETYDLVIFGDVIEHLKKSAGIDAINFYVYRTKNIIVQWPYAYVQNTWEGHKHENHIAVWSKHDFINFTHRYYEKEFMRLVVIDGYLNKSTESK